VSPGVAQATSSPALALERARSHLASLQQQGGWWRGELETNVTMDAEDLLMREFLGIRTAAETAAAARWIRGEQRPDGTWGNYRGAPGDLSTTIEAYLALRLAGDTPAQPHMARAARWVRAQGGVEQARVFTHIWLALFGLWSWERVPAVPPEMVLLPSWVPLNIYDFACWARQTVMAIALVSAHRPVRPLGVELDELRSGRPASGSAQGFAPAPGSESEPGPASRSASAPASAPSSVARSRVARAFGLLDRVLHTYERHPLRPLRRFAVTRATDWVLRRQEANGGWGGIQPPWVYSILALHLGGMALEHPVLARALRGLEDFLIEDERGRRLEACQSPVWDTALAMIALHDAGAEPDDPALVAAAEWLIGKQILAGGDWQVRRPDLAPGGWAFEFANDGYPDIDDTAESLIALHRTRIPDEARRRAAIERGLRWMIGMQSRDGGWGAFDAENTRTLIAELPFFDFGAVIDPPSADVTAHVVEALALLGHGAGESARRGVAWLRAAQEDDGSWFGRWGVNHVYGVGAVLPALIAAGVDPAEPCIRRAVSWLEAHQNEDGGWGEDCRSYVDPAWVGRGASTASQTGWALLALHAAGERSPAPARGLCYLTETQTEAGTWDEPWHTGTGFPGDFYLNYHLYRLVFPLTALGRLHRDGAA
jgi:squalene-hopene/tetraprenyl-beta-curcumene cyclase